MGAALSKTCDALGLTERSDTTLVAEKIIELAERGLRNPTAIHRMAMTELKSNSHYGFTESLEDFTTANLEGRRSLTNVSELTHDQPETRADQIPRPVPTVESSDDWKELHKISTLLIPEGDLGSLYNRILDAATSLMSSDMASMQLLDP